MFGVNLSSNFHVNIAKLCAIYNLTHLLCCYSCYCRYSLYPAASNDSIATMENMVLKSKTDFGVSFICHNIWVSQYHIYILLLSLFYPLSINLSLSLCLFRSSFPFLLTPVIHAHRSFIYFYYCIFHFG